MTLPIEAAAWKPLGSCPAAPCPQQRVAASRWGSTPLPSPLRLALNRNHVSPAALLACSYLRRHPPISQAYADNFENEEAVPEWACTGPQKACYPGTKICEQRAHRGRGLGAGGVSADLAAVEVSAGSGMHC